MDKLIRFNNGIEMLRAQDDFRISPRVSFVSLWTQCQVFDELGYLAIPPCIWGTEEVKPIVCPNYLLESLYRHIQEGLIAPVFLPFNANLTSIKRNNNTYTHYGEMSSWQMRGVLANLPTDA